MISKLLKDLHVDVWIYYCGRYFDQCRIRNSA